MKKPEYIYRMVLRVGKKLSDDNLNAFSAQAAFFLLTSMFPFIMMLLSLLQFFPFDMNDLIDAANIVLPNTVKDFIVPVITEIYQKGTTTLISVTAVTTLWSASTGVNAVVRGLTKIFDGKNTENWFWLRFQSIFYMLGFIIVIILSLGLFVFGNIFVKKINSILPRLEIYDYLSVGIRTLAGFCVLTLIFDLIYLFAPRRKSKFTKELPGAALSAAGWVGFSFLYSFYVNNAKFSVYGSLTAVVLFMLWMYVCFYILFIGAEINMFLQNSRNKQEMLEFIDELKAP